MEFYKKLSKPGKKLSKKNLNVKFKDYVEVSRN